jgi:hypothetical protein
MPTDPLNFELTKFLLLLSFDPKMRAEYETDAPSVVAQFPLLDEEAKKALLGRDPTAVREALTLQIGNDSVGAAKKKAPKKAKKAAKKATRGGSKKGKR